MQTRSNTEDSHLACHNLFVDTATIITKIFCKTGNYNTAISAGAPPAFDWT